MCTGMFKLEKQIKRRKPLGGCMSKIGTPEMTRGAFNPKSKGFGGSGPSKKDARGGFDKVKGNGPGAQGARGGFKKGSENQKSGKK